MKHALLSALAGAAALCAAGAEARAEQGDINSPRAVKTEIVQPTEEVEAPKPDQTFAKRLFGGEVTANRKSYVCFVRQYDAAHLAQHPQQTVRLMKLLLTAEIVPEDTEMNYGFRMDLKLRKQSASYGTGGNCGHAKATGDDEGREHLGCGVDCDGGSLTVELKDDNRSLLVKVGSVRISREDGNEDSKSYLGNKDDQVFRLDRAPIEQCKSLANDAEERAVMLRK
jgi:hypothetical protein